MLNFLPLNWICHCFLNNNVLKQRTKLSINCIFLTYMNCKISCRGYFFNRCKYVIHVSLRTELSSNKQGKNRHCTSSLECKFCISMAFSHSVTISFSWASLWHTGFNRRSWIIFCSLCDNAEIVRICTNVLCVVKIFEIPLQSIIFSIEFWWKQVE